MSIGRTVDSSFVNAPDWVQRRGDLQVNSQVLYRLKACTSDRGGSHIIGDLFVWEKDDNGMEYPYYPPVTAARNRTDGKALSFQLDEVIAGYVGVNFIAEFGAPKPA